MELYARLSGSFALVIMAREAPGKIYCLRKGLPSWWEPPRREKPSALRTFPLFFPTPRTWSTWMTGISPNFHQKGSFLERFREMLEKIPTHIDWDVTMVDKGGYPHFMLKEINEQGAVLRNSMAKRLGGRNGGPLRRASLDKERRGLMEEAPYRRLRNILLRRPRGGAFSSRPSPTSTSGWMWRPNTATEHSPGAGHPRRVSSPSRERRRTPSAAERIAREKGARCLAVTNVIGSTIAREFMTYSSSRRT